MSKRAVLLLHGFSTDHTDFAKLIPFLEGHYDLIVNDDLPGHDSKKLIGFTAKATIEYVDKTIKLLEKEYDEIDLIGFSMGGALATYLASNHCIRRMVLLAPANVYINALFPFVRAKKYIDYLIALVNKKANIKIDNDALESYAKIADDDKAVIKVTKDYILPNYNIRTITEFVKTVSYCNKNLKNIFTNVLVIMGDIDQFVPKQSDLFLSKYCKYKITITYKNLSHMMLRSKDGNKIITQIKKFLFQEEELKNE